ncbi:GNAT family N-acetyltransferase [Acidovorax citrulli]|nr:N-acetyltransferase [Paracidovorax citrulli]MVT27980.1 GNAT family N-acetyltransferase [Paracidovorax citrulli]MVT37177.1 GNAT family N-acetyltransferase [Paracidovorax citrulli]UMT82194.1 GNAT family N-acetyltransferase [Paracidovorax citrulli]
MATWKVFPLRGAFRTHSCSRSCCWKRPAWQQHCPPRRHHRAAEPTGQGIRMAEQQSPFFLRPPSPADLERVLDWMQAPAVYRWFDFGQGRQRLNAVALGVMARSPQYCMRVFGERGDGTALGIVVLAEVQHPFGSASFWVARDPGRRAYRGITEDAARALLMEGFGRLGRRSINAWAVETNHRSLRLLNALGFRPYGVQQACHELDGRLLGRVHFELLAPAPTDSTAP